MKEEDTASFALLLDQGIEESNSLYTLQFPKELRDPALCFLQDAFQTMDFEVSKADEQSDGQYSVNITFTPIDIDAATQAAREAHLASMASADHDCWKPPLFLRKAAKRLQDSPQYLDEVLVSLNVEETDDGFSISDEQMKSFLQEALSGYMKPYDSICEILDAQDFLKSYLDASFKGEVTQFALHTGRTEEEALAWYEADVFDPPRT